jgi:hypothetical protein
MVTLAVLGSAAAAIGCGDGRDPSTVRLESRLSELDRRLASIEKRVDDLAQRQDDHHSAPSTAEQPPPPGQPSRDDSAASERPDAAKKAVDEEFRRRLGALRARYGDSGTSPERQQALLDLYRWYHGAAAPPTDGGESRWPRSGE